MKRSVVLWLAVLLLAGCGAGRKDTPDRLLLVVEDCESSITSSGDSSGAVHTFRALYIGGNHDVRVSVRVHGGDALRLLEETRALSTVKTYAKGEGDRYIQWWQSGETGSIWLFQPLDSIAVLDALWTEILYISHYRLARAVALAEVADGYSDDPAWKFSEACDQLVSWAEDYHRREGWPGRPRHVCQWIEREGRGGHKALPGETPEATAARLKGEWQRLSGKVMEVSRADGGLVISFVNETWPPLRVEFQ